MSYDTIRMSDPELYGAMKNELERQRDHIELIASENFTSRAVMEAMGSHLTNKYAEGYPGKRYYGGCEFVDVVEQQAIERAKELFGCTYANVQPHSGAQANFAVFYALMKPGDTYMGMSLDCGGHLSHGSGANISGTSDLAPLDGQAAMLKELFPDAKKVGIVYCSSEPNSIYQSDTITGYLKDYGYEVKTYTFSDSNDVASVTTTACSESDVLYIPTDNTAASCTKAINNVALEKKIPIVAGEEGICAGCGVATLSISYYDLGQKTGEMAYDILANGKDISTMEIQSAPKFTKKYNEEICKTLGIKVTDDYEAIAAE